MSRSLTSWRVVVLTLVVACIGIAPTFWVLWPKWVDSFTYSHGALVVPFCAWLLWKQKGKINAEAAKPALIAAIPLLGLLFAWTLAFAASIEIGASATMPLILLSAVWLMAGFRIAWIAAFPILLLYSAIPVWGFINGFLQSMTVKGVTVILSATNVPAFIQGNSVQIPSGWFEIAGGCSGLHFFIVGLTLSAAYGYLYLGELTNRLVLLIVAAAMSAVMNWIRVAAIITAGHITQMQTSLIEDHYFLGWILFGVLLVPFFFFAHWLEKREGLMAKDEPRSAPSIRLDSGARATAVVTISVVLLLPALVWGRLVLNEPAPVDIELPEIVGWAGPSEFVGDWQPKFRGPDGEIIGSYEKNKRSVEVYVNWYRSQSQGRELIGYGNTVAGSMLRPAYDRKIIDSARADHAKSLEIREIMADSRAGDTRLIWYYYRVGGSKVTGAMPAKLKQGMRTIVGREGTGLVAVSATCGGDDGNCEAAREVLRAGLAALELSLGGLLDDLSND